MTTARRFGTWRSVARNENFRAAVHLLFFLSMHDWPLRHRSAFGYLFFVLSFHLMSIFVFSPFGFKGNLSLLDIFFHFFQGTSPNGGQVLRRTVPVAGKPQQSPVSLVRPDAFHAEAHPSPSHRFRLRAPHWVGFACPRILSPKTAVAPFFWGGFPTKKQCRESFLVGKSWFCGKWLVDSASAGGFASVGHVCRQELCWLRFTRAGSRSVGTPT